MRRRVRETRLRQRRNPADVVAVGASGGSVAGRDAGRRRRRERALTIIIIGGIPGCAAYRDRVGSIMSSTGGDHDHGDLADCRIHVPASFGRIRRPRSRV